MGKFGEFLVYVLLRAVMLPFQLGGMRWARRLGAALGFLFYYVAPIRKSVIRRNLEVYFGDEWDEARMRKGIRDAYVNFGKAVGEFAFGHRITHDNVEEAVSVENSEYYRQARAAGGPIVIFAAHQTMWELSQSALHWWTEPLLAVGKRIHNRYLDAYLTRRREIFGAEMISQRGAIAAIENKAAGKEFNLVFMADQRAAKGKGVWVDVCGTPTPAMLGPALTAIRFGGIPILPVQLLRSEKGIVIRAHPPIQYAVTGDEQADIQHITQLMTDHITSWIKERPEEYFWFHNRFKVRPSEREAAAAFVA